MEQDKRFPKTKQAYYYIHQLTDDNLKGFINFLFHHFEEKVLPMYENMGVLIKKYEIKPNTEYLNYIEYTWKIARGERTYVSPSEKHDEVEIKKWKVDKLRNDYKNIIIDGSIIPSSYRITYPTVFKWHSILEFAIDLAMLRLESYQGKPITTTEALILGGYKNKESIMQLIRQSKLEAEKHGPKDTIYIDSREYINLLKKRKRLFWEDIVATTEKSHEE